MVIFLFFLTTLPSHPLKFGLFMHHKEFIFSFLPSFVFVLVSRKVGSGRLNGYARILGLLDCLEVHPPLGNLMRAVDPSSGNNGKKTGS